MQARGLADLGTQSRPRLVQLKHGLDTLHFNLKRLQDWQARPIRAVSSPCLVWSERDLALFVRVSGEVAASSEGLRDGLSSCICFLSAMFQFQTYDCAHPIPHRG